MYWMGEMGLFRIRPRILLMAALAASLSLAAIPVPAVAADELPNSIAAAGDSLTQAYNIDWCCIDQDNPAYSWSTGDNPAVRSLYQRLLAINPDIERRNWNVSQSGTKMAALRGQLQTAAYLGAEMVTVQMGTNDLCAETHSQMTPTATFQNQYRQALTAFFDARPNSYVYQMSIPNWYRLWAIFHNDPFVQWVWDNYRICGTMLSSTNSESDRQWALWQEQSYNDALQEVCWGFSRCIWDRNATFNANLTGADFSAIDWFHHNYAGQNRLAQVAWDTLIG